MPRIDSERGRMNFCEPSIRRPVGTTLLAIGLFLVGAVAYHFLPVASMPTVEFPTIRVTASRPGADPETMAATVAAPLERRLGEIPGVTEMTSRSSLGSTRITIQFDLNRDIDGAARDVQAALNAALTDLPGDLPTLPSFRKVNPSATPIMILALTSKHGRAERDVRRRRHRASRSASSQVDGVAEVTVNGAEQPAIRIRVNPVALASMGLSHGGRAHRRRQRQCRRPARHASTAASAPSPSPPTTSSAPRRVRAARDQAPPTAPWCGFRRHRLDRAGRAQQPLGRLVQPASPRCCWSSPSRPTPT